MWSIILLAAGLLAQLISAAPREPVVQRQAANGRMVFAHFMMGIVGNRQSSSAYDEEFGIAKAAGIDAFALNMGPDVTNTQLGYAYDSAARVGIKVFISFDFNSGLFSTDNPAAVGERIRAFKSHPAQLIVDNKPFVSTFVGFGLNVASVESTAGTEIFFFPNWYAHQDQTGADGLFNWMGWYNDGNNNPGTVPPRVGDDNYIRAVGSTSRYMAPVAPWFSAHYGGWVPYFKNWIFQGNDLWFERWREILQTGPRFIEIVAWNDYGESSYVGPIRAQHVDDGHSGWINDMPHGGWLEMAKPFIAAFKSGATSPTITEDKLVYWYRPMPKGVEGCPDPLGKPNGWDLMTDEVFVVALLKEPGTIAVTSGSNTRSFEAPRGASIYKVPMGVGTQRFTLKRGGNDVMSETSLRDILNTCPCGLYNFNAYVGTVPAGPADVLVNNDNIKKGGGTCEPRSSLPIRAPTSGCTTPVSTVAVTFESRTTTIFGQTIKLMGSIPALGFWNTAAALILSADQYTAANPLWKITVNLPAGTSFEYKFINVAGDGVVTWESGENRVYTVPSGCETGVTVSTSWK